jgi:o-succinylbenzoate synthase
MLKLSYKPYTLKFRFEAGTSRGVMRERKTYFVYLTDAKGKMAMGEAAPLDKLSIDATPDFETKLANFCKDFDNKPTSFLNLEEIEILDSLPSIKFAMETAFLDYQYGCINKIFDNNFSNKKTPLPINGLIWMGNKDFMLEQISEKLVQGYTCLKLKIGAINFEEELKILATIRRRFSADQITLRLDANGAFVAKEALDKLKELAHFDIHSIEQPIAAKQASMAELCAVSPIPIAFDEELIGIQSYAAKEKLLTTLKPTYIILKPTLLGGFAACDEWIEIAEKLGIAWWITSALESNVGLNAICQYTAQKIIGTKYQNFPQGLGTGQLYENNIDFPLAIQNGFIYCK